MSASEPSQRAPRPKAAASTRCFSCIRSSTRANVSKIAGVASSRSVCPVGAVSITTWS